MGRKTHPTLHRKLRGGTAIRWVVSVNCYEAAGMVPTEGLELSTYRLQGGCSTN